MAIRGYVELVGRSEGSKDERKKLLEEAIGVTRRDSEKKIIQNAIKKLK